MSAVPSEDARIAIPFTCKQGAEPHDTEAAITADHSSVTEVIGLDGNVADLELVCALDGLVSVFPRQSPAAERYFEVQALCADRAAKGDLVAISYLELFARVGLKIKPAG